MRTTLFISFVMLLCVLLLNTGCVNHLKHQGNVLKPELVAQLHIGDARLRVEMLLGTPMLQDITHPNRALYVEDFENLDLDDENKRSYRRMVDIHYDRTWRISSITISGFDIIDK